MKFPKVVSTRFSSELTDSKNYEISLHSFARFQKLPGRSQSHIIVENKSIEDKIFKVVLTLISRTLKLSRSYEDSCPCLLKMSKVSDTLEPSTESLPRENQ